MPSTDITPPAFVAPDAQLTYRYVDDPEYRSLICEGPLGAVELRILPSDPITEMSGRAPISLEFHSRQPNPVADSAPSECDVLGGDCYHEGTSTGVQEAFEPLLRAHDRDALLTELARRYQVNPWTDDL